MANATTTATANTTKTKYDLNDVATTYYANWAQRQEADDELKRLKPILSEALSEEGVGGVLIRDHNSGYDCSILEVTENAYALLPERVKECLAEFDRDELLNDLIKLMTTTQLATILKARVKDATPKQIEGIVATLRAPVKTECKLKVHVKAAHTFTGAGKLIEPKLTPTEAATELRKIEIKRRRKQVAKGGA